MTAAIVAIVSACVAAACALYAWRTAQQERRRSDARVAALAEAIDPLQIDDPTPIFGHVPATGVHPLLKVAAGFGTVVAAIVIVAMTTDALERDRQPIPQTPVDLQFRNRTDANAQSESAEPPEITTQSGHRKHDVVPVVDAALDQQVAGRHRLRIFGGERAGLPEGWMDAGRKRRESQQADQ